MTRKLIPIIIFAVAFAFVESSVVFYLHNLLGDNLVLGNQDYKMLLNLGFIAFVLPSHPVLENPAITIVEMIRELATIIMLIALGLAIGKNFKQKLSVFLMSFAVWDLFYYVFLIILTGWPSSLLDIDVFFLIPIPWVGPVLTPVVASVLLFIYGSRSFLKEEANNNNHHYRN